MCLPSRAHRPIIPLQFKGLLVCLNWIAIFLVFWDDLCFSVKWICQPFPPLYWIIIKEPIEKCEETSFWSNPVTLPLSYSGCQGNAPSQFPCINCRCISYFWLHPTCISITTLPTTFFFVLWMQADFWFSNKAASLLCRIYVPSLANSNLFLEIRNAEYERETFKTI